MTEAAKMPHLSAPKGAYATDVRTTVPCTEAEDTHDHFEIIGSDGTEYKMPNWTDEEFELMGLMSFFNDDDTITEDIFDVTQQNQPCMH